MIKTFKSNKFVLILLLIMCTILLFNPLVYAKACLSAISVWATKVLPLLFPFFVLTKLILNVSNTKKNFMDKFFSKVFHAPNGSASTFFLSTLAGYPVGAKLICDLFNNKQISTSDAKKMMSFCSVSGPMFMLGTVGLTMLLSFKAGMVILISNIVASLLNGLIYRGKKAQFSHETNFQISKKETSLGDCVYDSLISILMVGAFIALSFIIIEMLNQIKFFNVLSFAICWVFNNPNSQDVVVSVLKGVFEITGGIFNLSMTSCSLRGKTIISSGLIGFGGISVLMQSLSFLSNLKMPVKVMLKQKFTQALFAIIVAIVLSALSF